MLLNKLNELGFKKYKNQMEKLLEYPGDRATFTIVYRIEQQDFFIIRHGLTNDIEIKEEDLLNNRLNTHASRWLQDFKEKLKNFNVKFSYGE